MADPTQYPALANPHIRLIGNVDYGMYARFQDGIAAAGDADPLVVSITTLGGDPEVARAMGEDIRLLGAYQGRGALFLGKSVVYSAGATFMSYFRRENRFLTRGTRIMIHERILTRDLHLEGPLRMVLANLKAVLHEIEHSIEIEEEGFRLLIDQSKIGFDEIRRRAPENWYIEAGEARDLGLVLDVI
jgi:ATP-dependent protease ClpP protease subunit